MLAIKRLSPEQRARLLDGARRLSVQRPGVEYPDWYLHRWHLLPEGYLSSRSVRLYDRTVRRLYHSLDEGSLLWRLAAIARHVRPEQALEVGIGPGRALALLARSLRATAFTGVDLSPFMLEEAAARAGEHENVSLVHANALDLPFERGRFDFAFASHVFGHMPRGASVQALAEATRVLRPDGWLALVEHRWHRLPIPESLREVRKWPAGRGTAALALYRLA